MQEFLRSSASRSSEKNSNKLRKKKLRKVSKIAFMKLIISPMILV